MGQDGPRLETNFQSNIDRDLDGGSVKRAPFDEAMTADRMGHGVE